MKENLAGLATEMVNPETQNIDRCSTLEMVELGQLWLMGTKPNSSE